MASTGVPTDAELPASVVASDVSFDVSKDDSVQKLRPKAMGLAGVLFLALTGSAPLAVVLF